MHRFVEHGHGVGEVQLALIVVGAQLRKCGGKLFPVEAVDPSIGQVVTALVFAAIAVFNNAAHLARCISKNAPITGGVRQPGGEQGDVGTTAAMGADQFVDGLSPQEWHVSIEHQQLTAETLESGHQLLHGMAGAVLRLLEHKLESLHGAQLLLDSLGLVPHDQQPPVGLEVACAGQDPLHQGGSGQRLEHFRKSTLHAGAFSGGQDGNGEHLGGGIQWPESTGTLHWYPFNGRSMADQRATGAANQLMGPGLGVVHRSQLCAQNLVIAQGFQHQQASVENDLECPGLETGKGEGHRSGEALPSRSPV